MKKLLLASAFVLSFAPPCFSQEKAGDEGKLFTRRLTAELKMIELEEDSARITTEMKKKQYKGGEDAILEITLKNVGTKAFFNRYVSLNDQPYEFYDIDVTDQTGRKIPRLTIDWPLRGGQMGWGLGPGDTQKASIWLNNLFDLARPGTYKVVVSKKFRKDGQIVTMSSDPLEFEVTSGRPIAAWGPREDGVIIIGPTHEKK